MVCPYCSTDMEPIELNGKVFCSNCGLTIKTLAEPTRLDPNASVVSGYKNPSLNEPIKNDSAFPTEGTTPISPNNMNPITDSAKEELGIEVNHPENDLEAPNNPPLEITEEPVLSESSDAVIEENSTAQITSNSPEIKESNKDTDDIDSIVKTLSQADLQTHKPLPGSANSEQIKEIESLAAGSILLDILSDDLIQKEDEAEVKVLDAAKKLVKHIKPADISEANNTESEKTNKNSEIPETSNQIAIEKEAERSETEEEIKQIEDKIHNLEEKSFEVSDKEIKKYDPDALDMAHLKIEHKTSRIVPNNDNIKETIRAAIIPQSVPETNQSMDKVQQENIPLEDDFSVVVDKQLNKSELNLENEVGTTKQDSVIPQITPEVTTTKPQTLKQKNKKPFSFSNLFKSNKIKKAKPPKDVSRKSLHDDANIKVERKSSHVSPEYFKKIIEINKAQNKIAKPASHNNSKGKKAVKNKKNSLLYIFIGFISFFVLITAIFMINNSTKPEAQIEKAISSATFNTKKPNYIPEGYILSNADFDKTKNIYKLEYRFATDKNRKIIFEQTKQSEPTDYINNLIKFDYKDKEFTQKTVAEQDYTEVAKYTILWNRAEMVYTISATNTIMDNNLLYKMAESIE
jgi:hypothetical protein